jgi:hypothetical protein
MEKIGELILELARQFQALSDRNSNAYLDWADNLNAISVR